MRELELDGIHDDGEHVTLLDSDGEQYTLRIDKALRAAVRTDRPALGMIQAADSAPLRPREIQAMLRSGRSAEDIAEAADIPLERVRRFEGPVLAEREWTAQRARTFPVGRGGPSLDAVVAERLAAREATGETTWDAWRRADGTWTLELSFSTAGRTREAQWVADLDNRSVAPVDDEARWISDEDAPPEPNRGRARLQAVKTSVYDVEADGSFAEKSAGPRRGRTPWPGQSGEPGQRPASDDASTTIDAGDLDALNARRGLRSVPPPADGSATVWTSLDEELADSADSVDDTSAPGGPEGSMGSAGADGASPQDDLGTFPTPELDAPEETSPGEDTDPIDDSDRDALLQHSTGLDDADGASGGAPEDGISSTEVDDSDPAIPAEDEDDAEISSAGDAEKVPVEYLDTVDLTPLPGFDDMSASSPAAPTEDGTPSAPSPAPAPSKPAKSRSKRASMPSWDEIVFGSKHD
jgi:Protein of unknown function (DUF3071)